MGRFLIGRRMVPEAGAFFDKFMTRKSSSGKGTSKSFTPYVLRSIAVSPQPRWFEKLATMEVAGVNGCQGTPWSEKLDGKELHGAAWWRLRSGTERVRCFLYVVDTESTCLPSIYKHGIILILEGWVVL